MERFVEFQEQIEKIQCIFGENLSKNLNLTKIRSPIYLRDDFLSDTLDGKQRIISFDFKNGEIGCLLHSLAKWKRCILHKNGFQSGFGIFTNMIAIRRDEDEDATHSFFVDQWDWEKVISRKDRSIDFLRETVMKIYEAFKTTDEQVSILLKKEKKLPESVFFISCQELAEIYPDLTPELREKEITKKHKAVFIYGMGHKLKTEKKERHCIRAPDYDDWNLNGDIIFYHDILDCALEVSSMGIRVDSDSIKAQILETNTEINVTSETVSFDKYQQSIIDNVLPLTIGGGIGVSRVLMYFLNCKTVQEIQADNKLYS